MMSMPTDLRRKIEEDITLIEAGEETYRSLAKRYKGYNVKETDVYSIHQKKLQRMRVEEGKEELEALKKKIEKRREDLKVLDGDYIEKKAGLQEEIKRVQQQKRQVEKAFESEGLSWKAGVHLVTKITNLKGEKVGLEKELPELRAAVMDWKASKKMVRYAYSNAKRRYKDLSTRKASLEREFSSLIASRNRYAADFKAEVARMEKHKANLTSANQKLEEQNAQLKEVNSELRGEKKLLGEELRWLKTGLENVKKNKAKIEEECEKLVGETREHAKLIIQGAEEKRKKALEEAEGLRKEKAVLEAETELVRAALKEDVQKLGKKPREDRSIDISEEGGIGPD